MRSGVLSAVRAEGLEIGQIRKWNTKYLRKLENHTNALAVNLLDKSETTHRLKRYTVLTLPDRPE
jgi:hypothetical protein